MKLIKSAALSTLILLSTSAFAEQYVPAPGNYIQRLNNTTIDTEIVKSKSEAYKVGLKNLSKLYSNSSNELFSTLRIPNVDVNPRSIHVNDGGYITVEEMMNINGDIIYRGVLNVSYHFSQRDYND